MGFRSVSLLVIATSVAIVRPLTPRVVVSIRHQPRQHQGVGTQGYLPLQVCLDERCERVDVSETKWRRRAMAQRGVLGDIPGSLVREPPRLRVDKNAHAELA